MKTSADPKREAALQKILIVEDDELFRGALTDYLEKTYEVLEVESAEEALEVLSKSVPDLILLDLNLPGMDGMQLLSEIKSRWPVPPVIMITAVDDIPRVVESIRKGAFDYLAKPINSQELVLAIERAFESSEWRAELEQRRTLQMVSNGAIKLIGKSDSLENLRQEIAKVAPSDTTILVEGETGTGKELVAQAIHALSPRANKPFVVINCGAIPHDLIESELFGHKQGAFTGATKDSIGKFQLAHRGTLVLDEVAELSPPAQVKLLRVLEERQFYPVGSSELVNADVRVIASTNRNLKQLVEQDNFREDLFFRLHVYKIWVAPLRERPEDIPAIADFFIDGYVRKSNKKNLKFDAGAKEILMKHRWPGNVRELRNVIERAVLFTDGNVIRKENLNFMEVVSAPEFSTDDIRLPESGIALDEVEKSLLKQALELAKYNKSKAAKLLNLTPPAFYYRLEKYGLK